MDQDVPYSDESEGSDQQDLMDRGMSRRTPEPPSPRTPPESLPSRNGKRHHRRHHSSSHDVLKLLEDQESKSTRKFLRTALARLDNETYRAQEAERRALELAERFKVVNDARLSAQAELSRVNEELRLYKVQYDNAQREIHRGTEILRDLEKQRDEAEARAAKDRNTARRLREEQLMNRAREEGRQAGFAEGLKRGLEEARYQRLREEATEEQQDEGAPFDDSADPLDDLDVRNLPSPGAHEIDIQSPVPQRPIPDLSEEPQTPPGGGSRFREHGIGGTPGTMNSMLTAEQPPVWPESRSRPVSTQNDMSSPRYHDLPLGYIPRADEDLPPPHGVENMATPRSPQTPLPIPPPQGQNRNEPIARDYAHKKRAPSLAESIPLSTSTTFSQFDIVGSPSHTNQSLGGRDRQSGLSVIHEVSSSMEYSPGMDSRGMPEALTFPTGPMDRPSPADQFPDPRPGSRGDNQQQFSDYGRYSNPASSEDWRQSASTLREPSSKYSSQGRHRPTHLAVPGHMSPQTFADRELRPSSAAGGPTRSRSAMSQRSMDSFNGQYPPSSSSEFAITVQPPSGPGSGQVSPVRGDHSGYLSPAGMPVALPPEPSAPTRPVIPSQPPPQYAPQVPTVPNSPSMGQYPSLGMVGGTIMQKVDKIPPGFVASNPNTPSQAPIQLGPSQSAAPVIPRSTTPNIYGGYGPPPRAPPTQRSSSSSSSGVGLGPGDIPKGMHSRSRSMGNPSITSSEALRPKTPGGRPPSAASSSSRAQPGYAAAPIPTSVQYPAPPGAPSAEFAGNASPRSVASRLSGHQRSFSLNAGNTPAPSTRPLSTAPPPKLRRVPSDTSMDSAISGNSRHSSKRYDPSEYVDPAFFAVASQEPASVFSPNTSANTRANAAGPSSRRKR